MAPKVSIVVITYNSAEHIRDCMISCTSLNYENYEVVLVDQGSTDETIAMVKSEFPNVRVILNTNTGYSGGANKGFYETTGDYILIANPDIKMSEDYLTILIDRMEADPIIGVAGGKVLKFADTSVIDTTGFLALRNRRVVDRGQGLTDEGQFEVEEPVFGISGCLALYRRAALQDIELRIDGVAEVWDYDFFMYKEDIDVSWRLLLRGWKCMYIPNALAYHKRGTAILKRYTDIEVLKHRNKVSNLAKFCSYRNQRLMQIKNETIADIKSDFFIMLKKEILVFGYIVICEPLTTLPAFFSLLKCMRSAFKKRGHIQSSKKYNSIRSFLK